MTSFFAWLDHSEHERRKMLDIIDLFREQDTRDELGIGTIRDAIADLLVPGTSTIQTRARYFLFVPWIYRGVEGRRLSGSEAAQRARKDELALIQPLVDSGETEGVIGIEARDKLKRLPSAVYWQGLGSWGIRLFPGAQDQYHRALERIYGARGAAQRDDDGEPIEGGRATWDPRLPDSPKGFPQGATFRLTADEAEYLRDRITSRWQGTLLAWLINDEHIWKSVLFPWDHGRITAFPGHVQEQLWHARFFSETLHGAALLYNLMLAEKADKRDLVDGYREKIEVWSGNMVARAKDISTWGESRFWHIVRSRGAQVGPSTQSFVTQWLAFVKGTRAPKTLADDQSSARDLIQKRERQLKGDQARLHNQRALEGWGGAAGAAQLTFRWGKAERIMLDILSGLGAAHA